MILFNKTGDKEHQFLSESHVVMDRGEKSRVRKTVSLPCTALKRVERRRRRKEDDRCDTSSVYKEKLMRNREKEREWEKKKKKTPESKICVAES